MCKIISVFQPPKISSFCRWDYYKLSIIVSFFEELHNSSNAAGKNLLLKCNFVYIFINNTPLNERHCHEQFQLEQLLGNIQINLFQTNDGSN